MLLLLLTMVLLVYIKGTTIDVDIVHIIDQRSHCEELR